MTAATTLFGMSRSLWQMVLFRCLAGVFAGTIVTVRAMLSEISTKETQARAFGYFSFAYNLGMFVGPLLGKVFLFRWFFFVGVGILWCKRCVLKTEPRWCA